MKVKELFEDKEKHKKALFFTDFGSSISGVENTTGEKIEIDRFGVWDNVNGKPQVIDTNNDLEELKKIYGNLPMKDLKG